MIESINEAIRKFPNVFIVRPENNPDCYYKSNALTAVLAANEAAEYFHNLSNGWEWSWPIDVIISDNQGRQWRAQIDRESIPIFHVSKIEECDLSVVSP